MKRCHGRCKLLKELSEYYHDKTRNDGHRLVCKECCKEKERELYKQKICSIKPYYFETKVEKEAKEIEVFFGMAREDYYNATLTALTFADHPEIVERMESRMKEIIERLRNKR